MPAHGDILDRPESLGKPFLGSVGLHLAFFGFVVYWGAFVAHHPETWGTPNPGGGSVAINVVSKIPLPERSGVVNPLANNTQSAVPTPPPAAKPQRSRHAEALDAIPIPTHSRPRKPSQVDRSAQNTWRAKQQYRPNQLYSEQGQRLVSPMIGQTGSGGVGFGPSSPFGNRFGNYAAILQQRVAEKWQTGEIDPRIKTAPRVIVTFDLQRDGSVRDVRIAERSGNQLLDASAERAVYDASPFPPLPAGYERNDVVIEFWFELRR